MVVEKIELSLIVHGERCRLLVHHHHRHFVHGGLAAKKPGVRPQFDFIFMFPGGEEEWAVGHNVFRLGPAGFKLLDNVLPLGKGDFEGSDGEKIGSRVAQLNDERGVVGGVHSNGRGICNLSLVIFLRVDDIEEGISVLRSCLWV